jgi:hypothetical protein
LTLPTNQRASGQADIAAAGLCGTCAHAAAITSSKGSTFLQCQRSFADPAFARYPTLPVLRCRGYEPHAPGTNEQ